MQVTYAKLIPSYPPNFCCASCGEIIAQQDSPHPLCPQCVARGVECEIEEDGDVLVMYHD